MQTQEIAFYRLSIPEAELLANLGGTQMDLNATLMYCNMLEDKSGPAANDSFLWEAIAIAAVTRYARCFSEGVRNRSNKLNALVLENLTEDLLSSHKYILLVRNKHVAHSVNNFEEDEVAVQVPKNFTSSTQIAAVVPQPFHSFCLSTKDAQNLRMLCEAITNRLNELIKKESQRLLPVARSLPPETVKAFGLSTPHKMFENRRHDKQRSA